MTGELKQDDSISSLNRDIQEQKEKKIEIELRGPGIPKAPDHGLLPGLKGATLPFDAETKPLAVSAHQAGGLVISVEWCLDIIRKNLWEKLTWEQGATFTAIENGVTNIKLQQKQIEIDSKGENDVKNTCD